MNTTTVEPLRRIPPRTRNELRSSALPPGLRLTRALVRAFGNATPELIASWAEQRYFTPRKHRPPRRELEALAGAVRFTIADAPAGHLAAYVWPHGSPFPWEHRTPRGTVLLVHGWEGRGTQLGAFVEPLRRAGFRVVALDAPAHGASSGEQLTLPEMAEAITRVATELGPIHTVIAHSMGAAATALALDGGLEAESVVLIGSPCRIEAVFDRWCSFAGLPEAARAIFRRRLEERFGTDVWSRYDVARVAPRLSARALVVHDVDDAEVEYEAATRIAASWPGARLVTTAGLGHRKILRDEPVIEEVLSFVDRAAATSS